MILDIIVFTVIVAVACGIGFVVGYHWKDWRGSGGVSAESQKTWRKPNEV